MPFDVTVHPGGAIIEIQYPAAPTAKDVESYAAHIKRILPELADEWASLVDQRGLDSMPKGLLRAVATLNAFAQDHGMVRSARVVSDSSEGMQSWRIAREGDVHVPIRSFQSRDEALAWLQEGR